MTAENTPHASSYEATLTEAERFDLHALLLSRVSLHALRPKTIPWRDGPDKGMLPSIATLWKIQTRLRTEEMMRGLEGMLETQRATKAQLASLVKNTDQEELLDTAMAAIAREMLEKTVERQDPAVQKTLSRMLLKRADQRRLDRRLTLLEAEFEKNKQIPAAPRGKIKNANQP